MSHKPWFLRTIGLSLIVELLAILVLASLPLRIALADTPSPATFATSLPAQEIAALEALYTSTNGAGWTNKTGWMTAADPCTWYGVYCTSDHVTRISLGGNQLSGTMPPELANLTNLQYLELPSNQLTGSIPAALGSLSDLQHLFLFGNQLTGSVPPELGNLLNLYTLDLSQNQLTGTIPPELGNLSGLQSLRWPDNHVGGTIPSELGNLSNLAALDLRNNELTGAIPPQLGNLSKLQVLELSENHLDGPIPPELGNLPQVFYIALRANRLSGDIPLNLTNLTTLDDLYVEYNMLTALNPVVKAFVDSRADPGWDATQTIAPSNLHVVAVTSGSVTLAWNPILYYINGHFEVFFSTNSGGPFDQPGCMTPSKGIFGCTVFNLAPDTTYYFAVRTYSTTYAYQRNELWSDFTAPVQATTLTPTPLDGIGIYARATGDWYLRTSASPGAPDYQATYGGSWAIPVVGDWSGDGTDNIGVYDSSNGNWYLRNSNVGGAPDTIVSGYGGWWGLPVVGDWDGNGSDTIGLFVPSTGEWLLRNSNSYGAPDVYFTYGGSWGYPVVGDWN
ncbi:MAG: fibronectin type III domain-containing protein, partial [Anaerolineae bacterium]|nr:fibronectin type III domain-containing protein [Anaerolineae bacterium]